jgi:hypothetical protein
MAKAIPTGPFPEKLERHPRIDRDGDLLTIHDLRATRFPPGERPQVHWTTEQFDLQELTNMWFLLNYFSGFRGLAHAMLSFEFADGRVITPSVEIRPVVGQVYSAVKGFVKSYGLAYVWSTEADALLYRTFTKGGRSNETVHMLEATVTHSALMSIFSAAVDRTNQLYEHPEWYNSSSNSCSTNVFGVLEAALPGPRKTPLRAKTPGYLPGFLAKQGMIKMNGTLEETMERGLVSDRVAELGDVDNLSNLLRNRPGHTRS